MAWIDTPPERALPTPVARPAAAPMTRAQEAAAFAAFAAASGGG